MENLSTVQAVSSRVRMNLSQNAKGYVQFDITSEFPTVEEAEANLSKAIDSVKALVYMKGLRIAGESAEGV